MLRLGRKRQRPSNLGEPPSRPGVEAMYHFDLTWSAGLLVHLAALLQVLGLLNRRQLMLRGLILAGSLVYIAYYYFYPEMPLWGAMFWSAVLALANLVGITGLILERRARHPHDHHDSLVNIMKVLTPGEFRRLMQMAEWRVAEQTTQMTRDGEPAASLFNKISEPV